MRNRLKNNREVAHYWANAVQESGSASNMFFEDNIIYSYGRHFPIARRMPGAVDIILFTVHGYSNTTAKHINHTRRAIPHGARVFTVDNVLADTPGEHATNARKMLEEYHAQHGRAVRSRAYFSAEAGRAGSMARDFASYVLAFVRPDEVELQESARNLEDALQDGALFSEEITAKKRAQSEAHERAQEARRARRSAEWEAQRKREAERRERARLDWIEGKPGASYYNGYGEPVRLRIQGDTVETSQGANVPLKYAVCLFGGWKARRESGGNLAELENKKIGVYTTARVEPDLMTIGCHKIEFTEAERVLSARLAEITKNPSIRY